MAYLLVILVFAFVGLAVGLSPILALVIAFPLFLLFLAYVVLSRRAKAGTGGGESEHAAEAEDSDSEPTAPRPPIY